MKLRFRPIIKGDWRTYFPGDEDLVAKASKDTGWAIEDELVVKKWLGYEFFGEDYKTSPENLSCLVLFHPAKKHSNILSSTARVAIYIDSSGEVDLVTGLDSANRLVEPSLIPIVEVKLQELDAKDAILTQLKHQHLLSVICKKMANSEPLTEAELEFLFEVRHCIDLGIDTEDDGRIYDAREFYHAQAKKSGVLTNLQEDLLECVYGETWAKLADRFLTFFDAGCNMNLALGSLHKILSSYQMEQVMYCDRVDKELLFNASTDEAVLKNFDKIVALKDATILNQVVSSLPESYIAENIKKLLRLGVTSGTILTSLSPKTVAKNFNDLLSYGIRLEELIPYLGQKIIAKNLEKLFYCGADPRKVMKLLSDEDLVINIAALRRKYISDEETVALLDRDFVHKHFNVLHEKYKIGLDVLNKKLQ